MRRTLISFALVLTAGLPVSLHVHAGDNVFKEIGEDASKLPGRMGKTGKEVGQDLGRFGKQLGKDFSKGAKDFGKVIRGD